MKLRSVNHARKLSAMLRLPQVSWRAAEEEGEWELAVCSCRHSFLKEVHVSRRLSCFGLYLSFPRETVQVHLCFRLLPSRYKLHFEIVISLFHLTLKYP